jgi:hypothetical protein
LRALFGAGTHSRCTSVFGFLWVVSGLLGMDFGRAGTLHGQFTNNDIL